MKRDINIESSYIKHIFGPLFCVIFSAVFVFMAKPCVHWFILPVTLCGIILVKDAQNWLIGKIDLFDPIGIIAALGLHFFYLAPILNVYWDTWMRFVVPPPDWRPWIGYMAILNFCGLIIYKLIVRSMSNKTSEPIKIIWRLNNKKFIPICLLSLIFTLCLQVYVYYRLGGVEGYIIAYTLRASVFEGMGWIFMISESFPILLIIFFVIATKRYKFSRRWSMVIIILLVLFILKILFGGLRGSRSNIIWSLFWAVGIIHFWVRPLNRKVILAGIIGMVGLMYFYGLYKAVGIEAFQILANPQLQSEISYEKGRTLDQTILGDLSRSDVQAFLLFRLTDHNKYYDYKWGTTYLKSLTLLIPRFMRPDMAGKREAGTELQYGTYSEIFLSSRVYGLAGEAMLNFGFVSVFLAYAVFGIFIAKLRQFIRSIPKFDSRILIIPFLINLSIVLLIGDSDNILFFFIKNGTMPIGLLWFGSRKINMTLSQKSGASD